MYWQQKHIDIWKKVPKKYFVKRNHKFEDHNHCLEVTQRESKLNQLEKTNFMWIAFKKIINNKFVNNKSLLKSQQRFRSKKHNLFTKEVNKIVLSANIDKRVQSIGSIKTYTYRTRKDLVCNKEEIKCSNIRKQYKND